MKAKEYRLTCTRNEMQSIKVMGPRDAYDFARNFFSDDIDIYESCFIILTNRANRIIGWYKVSSGRLDATIIDKKIVCKVAIDSLHRNGAHELSHAINEKFLQSYIDS